MISLLKTLWDYCDLRRKISFALLILFTLVSSIIEVFSIAAIMPFIAIVADPENIFNYRFVEDFANYFDIYEAKELIIPSAVLFIFFAGLGAFFKILTLLFNTKFAVSFGVFLSEEAYKKTLYMPYLEQTKINSSYIISILIEKITGVIFHIIYAGLNMISCVILLIFTICVLMLIDFKIALCAGSLIVILYVFVSSLVYKKVQASSKIVSFQQSNLVKLISESLGSIRDIIIDSLQEYFVKNFVSQNKKMREKVGYQTIIAASPRYIIEALILISIVVFIATLFTLYPINLSTYLPVIGAMALGAQKAIPSAQMIYQSWVKMQSHKDAFTEVLSLVTLTTNQSKDNRFSIDEKIIFNKNIVIKNVNFQYDKIMPLVLKDVNLSINKGEKIGLIGSTGSGKSTFLDLLLGLLNPSHGSIFIDQIELTETNIKSWQTKIAHVPQSIYLNDVSILENIAFGIEIENINLDKINHILGIVKLEKLIKKLPNGLTTKVGEKGAQLSGGERQRIGIARALYKSFDLLVLDEATNALDKETENAILNLIFENFNDKTIIVLTHRIESLQKCNSILEVNNTSITIKKI